MKIKTTLVEDLDHFYFICTGILMCAISTWWLAALAALVVVGLRSWFRYQESGEV